MSCDNSEKKSVGCAVKSGISGMASKSASVAGRAGQAYAGQTKKNVETAKNVGGKVAGAAKGASQAYVGQTQKSASAIAGAARSVGGFYKKQTRGNVRVSAAVPGAVKSFLGDVRRAAQAHNEATSEPKQKALEALDVYKRGVMNTKLRAGGKVATAAVGAIAYTALGGAERGDRVIGAMNGVGWALAAATVARERAYLKTPEGQTVKDKWDGHVKEYSAARKTANANYAKTIFGGARKLAGNLKAARMEA